MNKLNRKRHRKPSEDNAKQDNCIEGYPPLPHINSTDLLLQAFTHKSLRGGPNDINYDNERLNGIGEKVLDAAVTDYFFRQRPVLSATDLDHRRNNLLARSSVEYWATRYNLAGKLRCSPGLRSSLDSSEVKRAMFCNYLAALYLDRGFRPCTKWIDGLISGDAGETSPPLATKKMKIDESDVDMDDEKEVPTRPATPVTQTLPTPPSSQNSSWASLSAWQPSPAHYSQPFVPAPPSVIAPNPAPLPNPLAPAQPAMSFLPLFNQTAMQRKVTVSYPAEFSGPAHAGQWTVQCVVNGIPKGVGRGSSKQIAKEAAARVAYYAMGWH